MTLSSKTANLFKLCLWTEFECTVPRDFLQNYLASTLAYFIFSFVWHIAFCAVCSNYLAHRPNLMVNQYWLLMCVCVWVCVCVFQTQRNARGWVSIMLITETFAAMLPVLIWEFCHFKVVPVQLWETTRVARHCIKKHFRTVMAGEFWNKTVQARLMMSRCFRISANHFVCFWLAHCYTVKLDFPVGRLEDSGSKHPGTSLYVRRLTKTLLKIESRPSYRLHSVVQKGTFSVDTVKVERCFSSVGASWVSCRPNDLEIGFGNKT